MQIQEYNIFEDLQYFHTFFLPVSYMSVLQQEKNYLEAVAPAQILPTPAYGHEPRGQELRQDPAGRCVTD